jgi:hypothetical protein
VNIEQSEDSSAFFTWERRRRIYRWLVGGLIVLVLLSVAVLAAIRVCHLGSAHTEVVAITGPPTMGSGGGISDTFRFFELCSGQIVGVVPPDSWSHRYGLYPQAGRDGRLTELPPAGSLRVTSQWLEPTSYAFLADDGRAIALHRGGVMTSDCR